MKCGNKVTFFMSISVYEVGGRGGGTDRSSCERGPGKKKGLRNAGLMDACYSL